MQLLVTHRLHRKHVSYVKKQVNISKYSSSKPALLLIEDANRKESIEVMPRLVAAYKVSGSIWQGYFRLSI